MVKTVSVGIIVACHNRISLTSRWLDSLGENLPPNWIIKLIAVDDGSRDGTYELLTTSPLVSKVVRGDGSWYWAKSMANAEKTLLADFSIDYILWANDDTVYFPDSLIYVEAMREAHSETVLVGQFIDSKSKLVSYGGMNQAGRHPFRYKMVETKAEGQRCEVFNGNFVLIPIKVRKVVGAIDGRYAHGYADFDYSKRADQKNVVMQILHEPLGECSENLIDPSNFTTIKQRILFLRGKKGMPFKSHVRYLKKYGPIEWPIYIVIPYLRAVFGIRPRD
jgi:GT2 family glycosyltransferase